MLTESAEMDMWFLGIMMVVAVAVALWSLEHDRGGRATVWLCIALVYLVFFARAQTRAESEHEFKHADEHRAVQEQMEAVQEL